MLALTPLLPSPSLPPPPPLLATTATAAAAVTATPEAAATAEATDVADETEEDVVAFATFTDCCIEFTAEERDKVDLTNENEENC